MADSAWTEERLLRMIEEQIRETSELDYKRSAALARTDVSKNELSKDVSAFANAGGGTLIYGIAEDEKRHVPERLDDGIDPSIITKEWLEDVISSSIHRKIDGVRIHVVPLTAGRVGRVSYVVEVPQSMRAPHMASDHKYYKRHNFKSEPMEEYEVRDVARRGIAPQLRAAAASRRLPSRPLVLPMLPLLQGIDFDDRRSASQKESAPICSLASNYPLVRTLDGGVYGTRIFERRSS